MTYFKNFDHPLYDAGHQTNFTLPPRWMRPFIAAVACSIKGHTFEATGTADGSWHEAGLYHVCSRCAVRKFEGVHSQEQFAILLRKEKELRHSPKHRRYSTV